MSEPGTHSNGGRRTNRWIFWLVHGCILAALIFADGPLWRFYRAHYQWVSKENATRTWHVDGADRMVVAVNTTSNGVVLSAHEIPIDARTDVDVYTVESGGATALQRWTRSFFLSSLWDFTEQFGLVYTALLACIFICIYDPRRRKYIPVLIVSLIVTSALVWFIQHMVGKYRPDFTFDRPHYAPFLQAWSSSRGFSFPSGHTACAFTTATFLACLYPRTRRLFFVLAALTGLSRIAAVAHWPADVYAAALLAYAVTGTFFRRFCRNEERFLMRLPARMRRWF